MQDNVQFHSDETTVDHQGLVTVHGVKIKEIVSNFNAEEVLDNIEFSVIMDYVSRVKAEDKDE